jgi:CHAT domain-containing protein/Flp pilus assembly protein TadD
LCQSFAAALLSLLLSVFLFLLLPTAAQAQARTPERPGADAAAQATSLCWNLILQQRLAEARVQCTKAVELAPRSAANTVNLGHTYLLSGDRAEAWKWYELTVPLISTEQQLRTGPLDDFALFERNGWSPGLAAEARAWFEERGLRWVQVLQQSMAIMQKYQSADQSGQRQAALAEGQRLLALLEAELGPENPMTGAALVAVALQYAQLNQFKQALDYASRAQAILERSRSPNLLGGAALITLSMINANMNRFDLALEQAQRAVAMGQAQDPKGVLMRTAIMTEALVHQKSGRFGLAKPLAERALAMAEEAGNEATTANAMAQLSQTLSSLGEFRRALQLSERALAMADPKTTTYSARLRLVAEAQSGLGQTREALATSQKALSAAEQWTGTDSEDTGLALEAVTKIMVTLGQHKAALPLAERALAIAEQVAGASSPQVARSLNNLALINHELGRNEAARGLYERSRALVAQFQGEDHPEFASVTSNLGLVLADMGQYADAERLQRQAFQITERALGSAHPSSILRANNLATLLLTRGRAGEALTLMQRAVEQARRIEGGAPFLATSLNNLAQALSDAGRYRETLQVNEESLALTEQTLGPEHPAMATRLNNLGLSLMRLGDYVRARQVLDRGIQVADQAVGTVSPIGLTLRGNLATLMGNLGDYQAELAAQRAALAMAEQLYGPEHAEVALRLNNLAAAHNQLGQVAQALSLLERALVIDEKALGSQHPQVALILGSQAALLRLLGRLDDALPLTRRAVRIAEESLGPDHPDTAQQLLGLGTQLIDMGRIGDALPVIQRAIAILDMVHGAEHPSVAEALPSLSAVYRQVGQVDRAIALDRRRVDICERVLGPDHPTTGAALAGLARSLNMNGEGGRAEPLIERALRIAQERQGPEHPDTAFRLNELALVYDARRAYDKVPPLMRRAFDIVQKTYGPRSANAAVITLNLAAALEQAGDLASAGPMFDLALQRAMAQQEPRVRFIAFRDFARYRARLGDERSAIFFAKLAVDGFQTLRGGAASLSDDMQRSLLDNNKRVYQDLARWLVSAGRIAESEDVLRLLKSQELFELTRDGGTAGTAGTATASLAGAEIGLDREFRALQGAGIAQANELESLRRLDDQGARLSAAQDARRLQLLKDQEGWRKDFERFMASVQPRLSRDAQAAGEQRQRIEAGSSALMGYIRDSNDKSSLRHAALSYVVTDDSVSVIVTTAEGATARQTSLQRGELNARVAQLRQLLQNPRLDPRPAAQALYTILLAPIEQELSALAPQVLVLNLTDILRYIPFAALHDGQRYLVQRYALALYPSAGFRGVHAQSAAGWQVAGLGLTQARQIDEQRFPALLSVAGELGAIVRDEAHPQGALPGQSQMDAQFTRRAFEQALARARQGKASVLHVASHFHLAAGNDYGSYLVVGEAEPLRLSALRSMNFSGVEMLTLSACNTASQGGRNENGSEIEGLGAIAQSSGARSVMATLWPVADTSTAALMQRFYQRRTQGQEREMTNAQAIRLAQLALLEGSVQVEPPPATPAVESGAGPAAESRRGAVVNIAPAGVALADTPEFARQPLAPYAHPFYWAPFVLMGNWL